MAQQQTPQQISRIFDQPPEALTCYSDMAQIISTGNEIELQKLGFDVKDALKALTGAGTRIEINFSGSIRSEADIEETSRHLAALIRGRSAATGLKNA
jgi:hypothetical protein